MDTGSTRSVIDRISPSIAGLCSAYIHKIELSPGTYRIYTPPQNIRNRQVRNSKFENIKIPPDSGNTRSYELRCHDMVYGCIMSALPDGSLHVIIDPRATLLSFKIRAYLSHRSGLRDYLLLTLLACCVLFEMGRYCLYHIRLLCLSGKGYFCLVS